MITAWTFERRRRSRGERVGGPLLPGLEPMRARALVTPEAVVPRTSQAQAVSQDRQKIAACLRRLRRLTPSSLEGLVGVFVALKAALSRLSTGRAGLCALQSGYQAFCQLVPYAPIGTRAEAPQACIIISPYHHHLIVRLLSLTLPKRGPDHGRRAARNCQHGDRWAQGWCDISPRHVCRLSKAVSHLSLRPGPARGRAWPLKLTSPEHKRRRREAGRGLRLPRTGTGMRKSVSMLLAVQRPPLLGDFDFAELAPAVPVDFPSGRWRCPNASSHRLSLTLWDSHEPHHNMTIWNPWCHHSPILSLKVSDSGPTQSYGSQSCASRVQVVTCRASDLAASRAWNCDTPDPQALDSWRRGVGRGTKGRST